MSAAMVISYLPWYSFSAVVKYISMEFGLTAVDIGHIIAAFQAGYVIVVVLTGWLADKIGVRRVLFWATLMTAIFSTAFVFVVQDKMTVLLMRMLTGCAAGAIYVPGMALLANWFEPNERGGAIGAYTGAVTAASAGGYFIAGPIAAEFGWRIGMIWTSVPVFLAAAVILIFVTEKPSPKVEFDGSLAGPVVLTAAYMGHMWELYAFWAWIGPFMVACGAVSGMASDEAVRWGGLMAACITLAGAPAVWIMGRVADKMGRTLTIFLCATCSLLAELFFGYLIGQSLVLIVACGIWIGFWVVSDSAIYKAGLTEMVSVERRGTFLGIQSAIGFSMTVIAPVVFGQVLYSFNGTMDPTAAVVWGPAFVILGLGAIAAPVLAILMRKLPQAKLMAGGKM